MYVWSLMTACPRVYRAYTSDNAPVCILYNVHIYQKLICMNKTINGLVNLGEWPRFMQ